jgi:phosphatidylserine/phosphatidylglycerophosphate/cardiolipin synthase-like enzyme
MRLKHYHLLLIVTLAVASWYLLLPPEVVLPPPAPRPAGVLSMITEPAAGLGPVLGLIRGARSSAELVMYQFQDRFVADALIAAHRRGVKVRVLLNHGYRGQADPLNEPAYAYLMTHGVSVKWTAALFDLTHQKSLIVDGKTVLIMTFNLTPQYYASGREFGIFDTDPHDVQAAKAVFEGDLL